jgi:hypothetical protein
MGATGVVVDVDVLRHEIRKTYAEVSTDQGAGSCSRPVAPGRRTSTIPNPSSPSRTAA